MKYNIAILIPCNNEEKNILKLYNKIKKSCDQLNKKIKKYIIYFINDCSTDCTKDEIKKLVKKYDNVKIIDLKKQSGKSYALQVGFKAIKKDIDLVFMMDGDLQDDPKEIKRFIDKIETGYDLVSGYKVNRLDNLEKRMASKIYNKVLNIVFKMNLHDHNCGFKCFKRKVLKHIKIYDSLHRYITVFAKYNGFKVGEIEVQHHKRIYGKSKYGITRYFIGFKDILRVKYIIDHQKVKYSFTNIILCLLTLCIALKINKIVFMVLLILYIIIYIYLRYNLIKYNKFNINNKI